MSDENLESSTTMPANQWREDLVENWSNVRLGHEAMMLDKIQRQNRIAEVNARNTMTGKHDATEGWPEDEEMGVSIGNKINHYYPAPPAPPVQPPVAQPPAEVATRRVWPYVLAALLGAGAVGPATYFATRATETVTAPDTDTSLEYTPGFGVPEYVE